MRSDIHYGNASTRFRPSAVVFAAIMLFGAAQSKAQNSGASTSFGPLSIPATAVIFDPDSLLSSSQLSKLGGTQAVKALSFTAAVGQVFTFSASGQAGNSVNGTSGPDGFAFSDNITSLGSISGFVMPVAFPLVGVFTNGLPSGPAPSPYQYSGSGTGASFAPLLNQVFFVGDGLTGTGSGARQTFHVPATATELWLGFADGGGFDGPPSTYGDNKGSLLVSGVLSTPPCSFTALTLAHVPGTDDTQRALAGQVGIGESVKLTANSGIALTWTIASGHGTLTQDIIPTTAADFPGNLNFPAGYPSKECSKTASQGPVVGTEVCFTAPYSQDQSVVTATFGDSSCSTSFATLEPTGLTFQRLITPYNSEADPQVPYDYYFETVGSGYRMGMISVAFLTPGNVSFVNAQIIENDHRLTERARLTRPAPPQYNLLFTVKGKDPLGNDFTTNGWLVGCDLDNNVSSQNDITQRILQRLPGAWINPSYWDFADATGGHDTPFSLAQTTWETTSSGYTYSKRQIEASESNAFVATPTAPAALLAVPSNITFNDDRIIPDKASSPW